MKTLRFDVDIKNVQEINPLFSMCDVYVCYPNLSRNNTWMSKDSINEALYSLKNVPIVGEYLKKKDNFGDHGGKIEYEGSKPKYVETTMPYGVVPESASFDWELVTEEDGTINDYLVVHGAYLWTGRYEEAKLLIGQKFGQSMEVEITDGDFVEKDGKKVFEIRKFIFSALCILGIEKESDPDGHVEPCFESASIIAYSLDEDKFKQQFNQMMKELKFSLSTSTPLEGGDTRMSKENFLKKEDWGTGDKIETDLSKDAASNDAWGDVDKTKLRNDILKASNYKSLVKDCYLVVEDGWEDSPSSHLKYPVCQIKGGKLVYNINGAEAALQRLNQENVTGEPKNKLKKIYRKLGLDTSNFTKEEGDHLSKKDIAAKFKLTAGQMFDEFSRVLSEATYQTEDWWTGEMVDSCRYWLRDYDESFVYVYDNANDVEVKIPYALDGDNIKVDYENASRIKYTPTDWEGGADGSDPDGDNDNDPDNDMMDYAKKVISEAKEKFASLKQEHSTQIESVKTEYESKLSEQQDSILSMTKKIEEFTKQQEQFTAKITELEQFKSQRLQEETQAKVDELFKDYSSYFSVEELESLKNRQSEFSTFEMFAKEVKALACDNITAKIKKGGNSTFAFIEKPADKQLEEDSNVFGRLEKYIGTK